VANYSYPINLPSAPNFKQSSWSLMRSTSLTQSAFTGKQTVAEFPIALWRTDLELPPMKKEVAYAWQAFFLKLRGRRGTFLLGDPDHKTPRGTARDGDLTLSSQANSNDTTLSMQVASDSKTLLAGDYIQIGDQLLMVVDDAVITNQSTDVNVEPFVKNVVTATSSVICENPKATMRIVDDMSTWSADHVSNYGIKFSAIEAI